MSQSVMSLTGLRNEKQNRSKKMPTYTTAIKQSHSNFLCLLTLKILFSQCHSVSWGMLIWIANPKNGEGNVIC